MLVWLYYIYFTTNIINNNIIRNDKNIQLKLDENDNNIQMKLNNIEKNNKVIFEELYNRIDKLISLNNKIP